VLGRAVGLSPSQVSRICRGLAPNVSIVQLARLLAAVGLELSARAYPSGEPIRDAAQVALLAQLRERLHPSLRWRTEIPLNVAGDMRAWDGGIFGDGWWLPVDAETRPNDLQALERREALKQRDAASEHMVLLLKDTRHNRYLVRLAGPALLKHFPVPSHIALLALAEGRFPGGSSIVFL